VKRLAVISRAVTTRGLNPTAPLRDSGIPWLGHLPAHWEVMKVKYVAKMESGHTPSSITPLSNEQCQGARMRLPQ
jgi:type I restriction enzyme S subunit